MQTTMVLRVYIYIRGIWRWRQREGKEKGGEREWMNVIFVGCMGKQALGLF